MFAKRWLWIALVWLVSLTGIASAQPVMTPDPINVGNVRVGSMGSADGSLSSAAADVNVDVVLTATCTGGGAGSFSLASETGSLTNINLDTAKTITATYAPTARGLRECNVNVFPTGTTMTPLVTFKVRGTGIAPVIGSTPATTHNFGAVRFNNSAATHTATVGLTISNSGDTGQDLVVNSISFVGGLSGDYAVSGTLPATITPGGSAPFTVTFDPAAATMVDGSTTTLQIASNDPVSPTRNISLAGTGATGVIGVTDIAYGIVPVGTSPSQNITISNTGSGTRGPLSVTQATFTSNGGNWFKFNAAGCVGSTTSCNLALTITNGTATLPVMCNPGSNDSGMQTAMVSFTSDTDSGGDTVAMLTCTAGRADLAVVQTPLVFGDQLINTPSAGQTVQITNSGNVALTYSLSFTGTNPTQFNVTGIAGCTSSCSLAAGASGNVTVRFQPTTVGAKTAALRVTASNDPDTTHLDVPVSGTGVMPVSTPSATTLAFGNIDVGDTSTGQMLTVTNSGTYPLSISAAHLFAGGADYTVMGTAGTVGTGLSVTVQPTQSVSWTIACRPSVMNSRPGTFRITSNHNGVANTSQDIALTCNGQQGLLVFSPTSHNFGGVRENETRMQTFTLSNNGNVTVSNITVAFTGTGTGYTVMPTTITSIAAGASVTVTATFAPLNGNDGGTYVATYTGMWGTAKTSSAAITLNGDGLTTGYDTVPSNPNALDFGDIRFDGTRTMNVSVVNTAGTALQIRGFTITPNTAQTGEFAVIACTRNALPITCPTMAAPYNSSGINDTIVLQVRFDPANRVAMMDATLTINSDLPMNPTRSVPLRGSSSTAAITLNPSNMVLDFGPTDLDAAPVTVTRMVTLTNTGMAPLDFTSVTKTGARYAFSTTPAPFSLAPNGAYNITVSYTPNVERPANQPDTGTIVFGGVAGVFGAPSTVTLQISGYGVDRHISVAPAPTFPATYKNPGDMAPVRPVTITNTGDATLNVSAVMLTNDPIWTLVNPDPVMVPGRGTHDFNVKFSPLMAGKAPVGHMTIMNNDNGMPLVSVDLVGDGLDRNVAVGPGTIDLGYVGIGMTVKLSEIAPTELLSVANADTIAFPISRIEIMGGNDAFSVQTLAGTPIPGDLEVAPRTTEQFDVEFTPNYEGDFTASAIVYLGEDPQPAVELRGRGLYVDTGGGGGCSTGRGNGAAMILLVIALAFVRRRRSAIAAFGALVAFGGAARADQTRNVTLPLFDPTPTASAEATFQLLGAEVAEPGSLGVFALASYAAKPLVFRTAQNDVATVDSRTTLELGGAYAFGAFELGARMPFYMQTGDALPTPEQRREMFGVTPADTARGDLTLHGKYQIGGRGGVSYGFAAAVTAPIATNDEFAGNDLPTGRGLFLLTLVRGPVTATINAGGVVREQAQVGSAIQRSGAVFGGGLSVRVLDKMWLAGEIYGELMPGGQTGQPTAGEPMGAAELGKPIEGLFGLRYQMARTTGLGIAVARGVTNDMGSPAIRGVFTLAFTPSAQELQPLRPPRPPEPEKDADGDGLRDELDTCPNEPEDKDLFDDADGCPDLDNDTDGIADAADKCPLDGEDKDRFHDDDGCPDKDNDGDGVLDTSDKCPLASEDRDSVNDLDGCPDPDNDGDGLLDTVDKCPREPETINGNNDDDGCPDKGNALVVLSPDRIETLESITFTNGARIAKSSLNVLGQIGATLRANPAIKRMRITVHVQPSRNSAADKTLSEQRAKAVREWLGEWGIDPLRLQAAGFGGTKPLVDPSTRGAEGINDRVELIILERE
jgi:outer membrane protein OmpA-like peptidoglycan-associated protein